MKKSEKDLTMQNELLAKIQLVVNTLSDIDEVMNNISPQQSEIDKLESDYLHIYEDYELTEDAMISVSKKLQECRVRRRNLNNMAIIAHAYNENKSKLVHQQQRSFFINNMKCTCNRLNQDYSFRVLTDEEKTKILHSNEKTERVEKTSGKHHTKPRLGEERISNAIRMFNEGHTAKEISEALDIKLNTVYRLKYTHADEIK